ncbi:MAG: 16S rRNA (cytidine(1402)-2'-O)-methyltransferase [Hydrococcus sp. C42_A2020_068]|uniref:16S rRNA (cytidine(1402)-2'-O)-methyltransferase n=1 Tax=Pleurocapsa sp. PCC 7327 TaxID=118163 RepID=UPI00029F972E|nr:16S rRNA (cytidine(1402)-2'-O)-methyltransferase [Pleurocapsa sp. PCC 7327]AFY79006.1 putative S-adenosylmethionine-dependent methyltransferase, YraL family [Pleurocapsa sp. PCC 7327]MBF2021414.1 16S rRNA (cytidine(1402)-2'-O)-methyltransferase [Hydrococcus sp. C42_A2020_068]
MSKDLKPGTLYLVGTPIGNLEDITFRAIGILQAVDLIAAEDTRHTGKLLQHFQIAAPQISYYEHNKRSRQEELLARLQKGETIALVTDAGMPGISDPGYELVKACIDAGISVIPIPGVTAAVTALAASGLPTDRFVFEGFLPIKGKERRDRLNFLKHETRTLILYEAPHRLLETLSDLASVLGENRQIVLARELTKVHEEFWRGTIRDAIALYTTNREPKGEFTLVVAGTQTQENLILSEEELKTELRRLIEQGMTRSQASRQLAQLTNIPRRQIYDLEI